MRTSEKERKKNPELNLFVQCKNSETNSAIPFRYGVKGKTAHAKISLGLIRDTWGADKMGAPGATVASPAARK